MGTDAPGQLLGFSLQYPRALLHLLTCGIDDKVCLEVFGDVGITRADSSKLTEEDKSSQIGNPVTDRSTDLWKTFYNWTNLVINGYLDVDNTSFILYVNKKGRDAIVNSFNVATDLEMAQRAVDVAWKKLNKLDPQSLVCIYIQFLKSNEGIFLKIIKNFEFQVGSGSGSKEVEKAIRSKHVSESQVEFIQHILMGWLHNLVTDKLSRKEDAVISWNEFDKYAQTVFDRARRRELIDFTLQYPLDQEEVKNQKLQRPPYIRQLEAINGNDDDILEAVTDFLKAKVNRLKWIEQELIDEKSAEEFEKKLTDFWRTQKKTVNITHANLSDEDKGMLVFQSCIARQQVIKQQDPPPATIPGTYHFMSNCLAIGWHPKWEDSFKSKSI